MFFLEKPKYSHPGSILAVASVESRNIKRACACKIRQFEIKQFNDVHATAHQLRWERNLAKSFTLIHSVLALLIALTMAPALVLAGGGNVLPGQAKPKGYSLSDMARATAFFNTGDHSLDTYPYTPFQILYVPKGDGPQPYSFTVRPGTMLYVPIFFSDDTQPVVGDFPKNVDQRLAVLNYVYAPTQLGATSINIEVDRSMNPLGSDYVVGVHAKLADDGGFGPGHQYIVFGAFLTPLDKGTHTVTISGSLNGAALLAAVGLPPNGVYQFEIVFTVIVH